MAINSFYGFDGLDGLDGLGLSRLSMLELSTAKRSFFLLLRVNFDEFTLFRFAKTKLSSVFLVLMLTKFI
jgi:hypothetical protein